MQQPYEHPGIGIRLTHDGRFKVVEDHYLGRTLGVSLLGPPQKGPDDGRPLVLRVGWLHEAVSSDAEAAAAQTLQDYPEAGIRRTSVDVGGHRGVALAGVPGRAPTTYVYVAAHGRVYEVLYGHGDLDPEAQALLAGLAFVPPAQTRSPLGLARADDVLRQPPPAGREAAGQKNPEGISPEHLEGASTRARESGAAGRGVAQPGCADWPDGRFVQTPWTSAANNGSGRATAGPSHYGQGFHKHCNEPGRLNDRYALDFSFEPGDVILAPAAGRVLWAGWATGGWAGLGRVVVVDLGDGLTSMAAHLSSIDVSEGQQVTIDTPIGRAGGSGHQRDGHWSVHLHQGVYLHAQLDRRQGGIHGGQSVRLRNVTHFGDGRGTYPDIEDGQVLSF